MELIDEDYAAEKEEARDMTHGGHLHKHTVFSQPHLQEQEKKNPVWPKAPRNILLLCLDNTFTCTCALNAPSV